MKTPKYTRQTIQQMRELTQRQYAVLLGRAAAGIWAALKAWGFQNRVVLIPANTCYIVLWAVLKSGNHPLLVDVDRRTGNMTVEGLELHRTSQPAAVIPCHMYGLPAPMKAICEWARANNVKVIEDAALALGATVDGKPAGSWGDVSIFSFGLGKIVDHQVGGALLTDDPAFANEINHILADAPLWDEQLMALTNQWNSLYWSLHQFEAHNPRLLELYPQLFAIYGDLTIYRLADEEWADIPALLRDLPTNLAQRAHLVSLYDAALQTELDKIPQLQRPSGAILWRYPLLVQPDLRADLLNYLWEQGFHEVTRWYPPLRTMTITLAPHLTQPLTPIAEMLGASIINLPLDEQVNEAYVQRTTDAIRTFLENV
jgi:dTDP-4-amino-4,6-dideoxygalactose transaminase